MNKIPRDIFNEILLYLNEDSQWLKEFAESFPSMKNNVEYHINLRCKNLGKEIFKSMEKDLNYHLNDKYFIMNDHKNLEFYAIKSTPKNIKYYDILLNILGNYGDTDSLYRIDINLSEAVIRSIMDLGYYRDDGIITIINDVNDENINSVKDLFL